MRSGDRLRAGLALIAVCALLLTAGCGDALPVEDRALVLALGIDPNRTSAAGDLDWTFVLPNATVTASSVGRQSPGTQVSGVRVTAPDLSTAMNALQDRLARKVYMGDLEVFAIGLATPSDRARAAISDLVQFGSVPDGYSVVATPDPATRLLSVVTTQDAIPRYFLTLYLNCSGCHRHDWRVRGWQWWAAAQTPGVVPHAVVLRPEAGSAVVAGEAVYPAGPGPALVMPPDAQDGLFLTMSRTTAAVVSGLAGRRRLSVSRLTGRARTTARLVGGRLEVSVRLHVRGVLTSQGGVAIPSGGAAQAALVHAAQVLVAQHMLDDVGAAFRWANREHCDPFGLTTQALLARPRLAYALAPGSSVWFPIDVRMTVRADVVSASSFT